MVIRDIHKITKESCDCGVSACYPHLNPLTSEGGAGLDLPHPIPDGVQIKTLGDLRGRGGCQQVLFVRKDQHWHPAELLLIQKLSQLL